jgi:hypothetical protein
MSTRLALPARRNHITQKVKIAGQRTLYISVHDDAQPAEIFLRLKGFDCSSELIGLYDVIARLMSLALQYGAPLGKVGDLLAGAKFAPCGALDTLGSSRARVSQISLVGICWWSTAGAWTWRRCPHQSRTMSRKNETCR